MAYDENQVPAPSDHPMYDMEMAKLQQEQYPSTSTLGIAGAMAHRPTVTEILMMRKKNLEMELEQINKALAIAQKNAGAMELIDAIAKTGHNR